MAVYSTLPKCLQPKKITELIRMGRNNDGGYLVDSRNISNADALVGLGVNDDWSFEEHFNSLNAVPIYAYDGTVSYKGFWERLISSLARIDKPKKAIHWMKVIYNYRRFFKDNRRHIRKLVGMDIEPDFISLSTIVNDVKSDGHSKIFFKIDIEGWEYRILNDLLAHADVIEGLVIEFHDVDLHLERIEKFVQEFPLALVHTHCNNFAPNNESNIPLVIECTFTRQTTENVAVNQFPNELDMPNKLDEEDYALTFV